MAASFVPLAFGVASIDISAVASCEALEFDYIVVGGGTAGHAVAARLNQGLQKTKILVIEIGLAALDELGIQVPGSKGTTLGGKYD